VYRTLNKRVRKFGGKLLYGLSIFDHVTASKRNMFLDTSKVHTMQPDKLCIYVTYRALPLTLASIELLDEVRTLGFKILHVDNFDKNENPGLVNFSSTFSRRNSGYDLAAVRDALRLLVTPPDELLIINSSVHYFPRGITKIVNLARISPLDVVGITESLQTRRHIQSYFFYSRTKTGVSALMLEYGRMRNWKTKRATVAYGEIRMMTRMESEEVRVGALISYQELTDVALRNPTSIDDAVLKDIKAGRTLNPTQHLWKALFILGMPLIKKTLLHQNPARLVDAPKDVDEAYESFKTVSYS